MDTLSLSHVSFQNNLAMNVARKINSNNSKCLNPTSFIFGNHIYVKNKILV